MINYDHSPAGPSTAVPATGGSFGQYRPTTTISTIAIKAGESTKLTLAVLKSQDYVQIRVDTMEPSFLNVGKNLEESLSLQKQHNELQEKLAAKQSNVEELLSKADRLVGEQTEPPDVAVYEAMADSLSSAWRDLNKQLQLRSTLLDHTVKFYSWVNKHQDQMDQLDKYLQNLPTAESMDEVTQIIKRHNQYRRDLLDAAVEVMTYGQITIEKIREIGSFVDNLERAREVLVSCTSIEDVMLRINDRRKKLEVTWDDKKVNLEWSMQAAQIYAELTRLQDWLNGRRNIPNGLGDSEAAAEMLAKEHEEIFQECKKMVDAANRLNPVADQLFSMGFSDNGILQKRCSSIRQEISEFLNVLENRRQTLHMSVSFFRAASTALTRLDNLETQIKSLSLSRHKDVLARQHAELSSRVQETAQPALAQGRSLSERVGSGAPGAQGVERKLIELQRRVAAVDELCTAHKADALDRSLKYQDFMQQYTSLHTWLVNIGEAFLYSHRDMGTTLSTVNEFLELHRKLLIEVQNKESEVVNFLSWSKTLELDEIDNEEVRKRSEDIRFRWDQVKKSVTNRNLLAELYYQFHKQSLQLATDMDIIEAIIKTSREVVDETTITQFEEMWSSLGDSYEKLKHQGDKFLTENRVVINDATLDVKSAQICVETLMEHFSHRHISAGRMWTEWQTKLRKDKEFQDHWHKFTEKCRRVIHYVSELQQDTSLAFAHFEEPPAIVAQRQEHALHEFRQKTQRTKKEIEDYLQVAETLGTQGDTHGEKEKLVNELLETHQQLQQTSTQFEVLTSMTVTFFRNLHQIDEWVERVEEKFQVSRLPKHDSTAMEQLVQEHRAASQTVEELVRFAQSESEQIIRRARQPDVSPQIRIECEKIPTLVEERVHKWEKVYEEQHTQMEQYCTVSKFEKQVIEVTEVVETLILEIRQVKESLGLSPEAVKVAEREFREMEKKIIQTDKRVSSVVTTAETYISGPYRTSPKLQERTNQLKQMWTDFRKEVEEVQEKFTSAKTYWTLVEETEVWTQEITEYIVDVGRKTAQLRSPQEAVELQQKLETYIKPKQQEQETRIVKMEVAAKQLYGENAVHKVDRHKRRYKEIIDSFHVVAEQVQSLKETLETTEIKIKEFKELSQPPLPPPPQPVVVPKSAPTFTQTLVDEEVIEGTKVELICKVAGQPKPIIKWYKDTLEVVDMPDYETTYVENVCTLKIEETFTEDSAVYTCRAINDVGTAETKARLTVKETKPRTQPPQFTKKLENTIVEESETTVLECHVIGTPTPSISWYKNELNVDHVPDYEITFIDGVCRLVIEETFLEDDAQYICRAISPVGEAATTTKLTVKPKPGTHAPVIVTPLQNVTVEIGEQVVLETVVIGQPVPEVAWYFNNRVVKESRETKTTFDGHRATLTLPEAYPTHVGSYTIVAKNRAGEASSSSVVRVRGKQSHLLETSDSEAVSDKEYKDSFQVAGSPPVFIRPLPNMNVPLHTTRLKLDCVLIGSPRPKVTMLFNGRPVSHELGVTVTNVGDTYTILIPQVTEAHYGTFTLVGENVHGVAKTSGTIVREDKPHLQPVAYSVSQPFSQTETESSYFIREQSLKQSVSPGKMAHCKISLPFCTNHKCA